MTADRLEEILDGSGKPAMYEECNEALLLFVRCKSAIGIYLTRRLVRRLADSNFRTENELLQPLFSSPGHMAISDEFGDQIIRL
jgi:hypothetical protein